ncbi:hypothetical protein VA249_22950 [Vibrio alfacsensis]|uniref:DUF3293 domain-containing protein n=1 Tax=Vibrio alfacsensis TaxID=1074311 RepID=UPI001BEFA314|nr:DUF3293 domain-containing protein [Vibrio alfacsensis]BBM65649.1 hypothetical protein VA249_22950 [Vibrio alfacsensis]
MIEKSNMKIDASLWHAYSNPFFHFYRKWNEVNYAVITAWNPYSNLRSKEENCISNHKLEEQLYHVDYVPVLVGDKFFEWSEESYATAVSVEMAVQLANHFQQNAIYYVMNNELYLIVCADPKVMHELGDIRPRLV